MSKATMVATSRLKRLCQPTVRNWAEPPEPDREQMRENAWVDMGWGRLLFGHTFRKAKHLAHALCQEKEGERDIGIYLPDPHVVLSAVPGQLFLDPSHTYRLWAHAYRPRRELDRGVRVRRVSSQEDVRIANEICRVHGMIGPSPDFMMANHATRLHTFLVATSVHDGSVLGTVTGVDHVAAFEDPENGTSLWGLAVSPHARQPGAGEALVRHLAEHYFTRGRSYVDLSVMHDNVEAIQLYEKLGFERVPVFCVKRRNRINESLYVSQQAADGLNPYARIIVDEALRRNVSVEVLDRDLGLFTLQLGGRRVVCRESLTELTSATSFMLCDDKRLTHRMLVRAGLRVPSQREAGSQEDNEMFLREHARIVVKPARGEQGAGVSVDLQTPDEVERAVTAARRLCDDVLLERYHEGLDLRVVLIDYQVVAAAVRRPPVIIGNGKDTLDTLIAKYNRRRMASTGGESRVPIDEETERNLAAAGYSLSSVPPSGQALQVRKAANLHTGGTIHDVTDEIHPTVRDAAVAAAKALMVPVTGLDFLVPDIQGPDYVIVEANERPGLANHEPRPTVERFLDLLFPETQPRHQSQRP
jgi:GNAT-family acetyltransferase (TIGR03103 family)